MHWVSPGVHTPVHTPFEHAALEHGCALDQEPVVSHVCTASPEQRTAPGAQAPVQEPTEHA